MDGMNRERGSGRDFHHQMNHPLKLQNESYLETKNEQGNLTKRVNLFSIIQRFFHKTSEPVYHNLGNKKMKLFSFGFVSKNRRNAPFTKQVEANLSPSSLK
jgi:hypothetical protein